MGCTGSLLTYRFPDVVRYHHFAINFVGSLAVVDRLNVRDDICFCGFMEGYAFEVEIGAIRPEPSNG